MPNAPELTPLETPRLALRPVRRADAGFLLELLNDPSWIANIGDRGVRTDAEAETYIRDRIWSQYATHGFGLYLVEASSGRQALGLCGLVKREFLARPDLGVALMPPWVGRGLAAEAAGAVIAHAQSALALESLYAITKPDNQRSVRMLERLGFRREGPLTVPADGSQVELYARP